MATLSQAIVQASNEARDAFLRRIDPAAFVAPARPVAPNPPAMGGPPGPPPPPGPPGAPPAPGQQVRALQGHYYENGVFDKCAEALRALKQVLATRTREDNFDYGGWFNYFFAEAKPLGNQLGRIFCLLFDLEEAVEQQGRDLRVKAGFQFPAALSPGFNRRLALEPAGIPLDVLTYLFEEGFADLQSVSAGSGAVNTGSRTHSFGAHFDLQSATNLQLRERDTTPDHLIFYRGDTREPATVIQHGGARCRADLAHWRRDAHVDAPWHPWKDATKSGRMWVRKGSADNDYFTVNSVAMDFHISCAYPMLRLSYIDKTLTGHITDWSDAERARLRSSGKADFCRIRNNRTGQVEFALCDRTRVYACVFQDDALLSPTYKKDVGKSYTGNDYPEMGLRFVDLEQIIAWFEIDRYHNNDSLRRQLNGPRPGACYESPTPGGTMTIQVRDWDWMYGANGVRNTTGIANPNALAARFAQLCDTPFEIDHSRLLSRNATTFDPSTRQEAKNVWATVEAPKLKV
jgi:hypothetical protein